MPRVETRATNLGGRGGGSWAVEPVGNRRGAAFHASAAPTGSAGPALAGGASTP